MDVLLGRGAEIGAGIRYRMPQEVRARREASLAMRREQEQKKIELAERNKQTDVENTIRDRLGKRKELADREKEL
jgi:hypothetical protein